MSSKSGQSASMLLPAALFFVASAFWAAIVVLGGGLFLTWAAATSLLSGVFLMARTSNRATIPLVIASSAFGLMLTIYQIYIGLTLVGTVLSTIALYNTIPFALAAALYVYLLFFTKPAQ